MTARSRNRSNRLLNGCGSLSGGSPGFGHHAKEPVLLILHQAHSNPGAIGRELQNKGYPLDIRRPALGEQLPRTLERHAGAVMFGGPMSANDGEEYVRREINWLGVPLREQKPFLGICLGAQMLVKHLGGSVGFHDSGQVEIGYYPIEPTGLGRELVDWPNYVYQWHREGFSVPSGARLLAIGSLFKNQAICVGPAAFGFQFHPEITLAMVHRWTIRSAYRLVLPGAKDRPDHLSGHISHGHKVQSWLGRFLDRWLACSSFRGEAAVQRLAAE